MTIRDFRYRMTVADCPNFRAATRRCHASQSTVSSQLRKLEAYPDVRCFDRRRGGVGINGEGRGCVPQARILPAAFDVMCAIAARRGAGKGLQPSPIRSGRARFRCAAPRGRNRCRAAR
ncbi:MAG: LysR family transcriptional regulator [Xanthomonadaceae bacterium]|nr:LysR family transcriptional regulator [Xanthomonadaceae bacterium]